MFDFDAWDISHEITIAFIRESRSSGNKNADMIEREMGETLENIHDSFYSAVMFSLNWRESMIKLLAKLIEVGRKKDCGITL